MVWIPPPSVAVLRQAQRIAHSWQRAGLSCGACGVLGGVRRRCSSSHLPGRRALHTSSRVCDATSSGPTLESTPYSSLSVGVPKEIFPNERRVALTPANAALLRKKGFKQVLIERGAGAEAQFTDAAYEAAGATLVSRDELFTGSDITLKVRPPLKGEEDARLKEGSTSISFLYPSQNPDLVKTLAERKVNAFAVSLPNSIIQCARHPDCGHRWT